MSNADIAKPHTHQGIHFFTDAWNRLEKGLRIFNRHIKNVCYAIVFELYFQSFTIIAFALAGFTLHIDIRQKMHLYLDQPIALAGLTAPPLDVEAEPTRRIAARLGFRQAGEPIPDRRKRPRIGRGVGPRGAANRALVDVDDLVQMLEPLDRLTRGGGFTGTIQAGGGGFVQGLDGQGRFAPPPKPR